jgi:hypothetical protein
MAGKNAEHVHGYLSRGSVGSDVFAPSERLAKTDRREVYRGAIDNARYFKKFQGVRYLSRGHPLGWDSPTGKCEESKGKE